MSDVQVSERTEIYQQPFAEPTQEDGEKQESELHVLWVRHNSGKQGIHRHQTPLRYRHAEAAASTCRHPAHYGQIDVIHKTGST